MARLQPGQTPTYAPPTGFVIEEEAAPAAALPPPPEGFEIEALPEGFEVEQPAAAPVKKLYGDLAPATTGKELTDNLAKLSGSRAPSAAIREYIVDSQSEITPEIDRTLQQYDAFLAKNPKGAPGINWVPNDAAKPSTTSAGGAAMAGLKSSALMSGDDEISGHGAAIGNWLARNTGVNTLLRNFGVELREGEGDYWKDYERERAGRDNYKDRAWEERPGMYGTGYAAGLIPGFALPGGRVAQIQNRGGRAAALSGVGGAYGTIGGALADEEDRLGGAVSGGVSGAVGGVVLPPLLSLGGNLARRVGERTGLNRLARDGWSELEALATRAPQNVDEMSARAASQRAEGYTPTLVDIMDETGAATVRAAATKKTPGRDVAVEFANRRRADVQDEVARAAEPISPTTNAVADTVEGIEARRTALADEQYEAIRTVPVAVDDTLRRVLDTGAGRRALKDAVETSDSPEEVAAFLSSIKQGQEPSELDRLMSLLPDGMNPAAREQVRQQLTAQGVPGSPPMPEFTLDMLDRVKRGLQRRITTGDTSGQSRQYQKMVKSLVDAGDAAAPGYAEARGNFAASSALVDAAEAGQRALTGGNPDEAIAASRALSDDATPVADLDANGQLLKDQKGNPVISAGPSARVVARQAARRSLENAAGQGPRGALALADQMASGTNFLNRTEALAGAEVADQVQRRGTMARERFGRGQFISPNVGSKTSSVQADVGNDLIDFGLNAMSGGKVGVARSVVRWLNNAGINNVDAERLVTLATDPTRVDQAITYMAERVPRREAARIVRSIRAANVTGRQGGAAQDERDYTLEDPVRLPAPSDY